MNSGSKANSYLFFSEEERSHNPDYLIINQVFEHYSQSLKYQKKIFDMIIKRRINPDYIERFKIGFSDRTLGYELRSPKSLLGSQNRGHLQRLGLLKNTGHEFFQGSLIIPYCDNEGRIAGAYGRRPRHQRRSPVYHLFWNAQQVSFFNTSNERFSKSLILCKSALEAMTLLSVGFDNVIATMGLQGFNETQLSRLLIDGVRHVCIAFDNTPAANRSALLVAQALDSVGINCSRLKLPLGQDINQFAVSNSCLVDKFNRLLGAAVPYKQLYSAQTFNVERNWQDSFVLLDDYIQFYLEESLSAGKSTRTVQAKRFHLECFQDYCFNLGIEYVKDLNVSLLKSYQLYLQKEKNCWNGSVISISTQKERFVSVMHMIKRLHYYGVFHDQVNALNNRWSAAH